MSSGRLTPILCCVDLSQKKAIQKHFRTQKFEVLIGAARVPGETFEMIMAEILGIAIGYEMAGRKSGKATAPGFYAVSRNRWLI